MKQLQKFWWTPPHQIKGAPAKFEVELLPLDQRAYLALKGELRGRGRGLVPTPDGMLDVFEYAVTNWRGHPTPFSEEAKREVIEGIADLHWGFWLEQIAAELLKRTILGEPEIKNS